MNPNGTSYQQQRRTKALSSSGKKYFRDLAAVQHSEGTSAGTSVSVFRGQPGVRRNLPGRPRPYIKFLNNQFKLPGRSQPTAIPPGRTSPRGICVEEEGRLQRSQLPRFSGGPARELPRLQVSTSVGEVCCQGRRYNQPWCGCGELLECVWQKGVNESDSDSDSHESRLYPTGDQRVGPRIRADEPPEVESLCSSSSSDEGSSDGDMVTIQRAPRLERQFAQACIVDEQESQHASDTEAEAAAAVLSTWNGENDSC